MDTSYQIEEVEKIIKIKERLGKDTTFEKELVKSWKRWLRKHPEPLSAALRDKSTGIDKGV